MFSQKHAFDPKYQADLMERIWALKGDYLAAAFELFPWGDATTPLARYPKGPRNWQCEVFEEMTQHYRDGEKALKEGKTPDVFTWACRSGHGTGKDAIFGMFAVMFLSFFPGACYITTANTEGQLLSKTMPEVCKWFRLAINKDWWEPQTMIIRPARWYQDLLQDQKSIDCKYHYAHGIPWSETNWEAFTGTHNDYGQCFAKSECSGIKDIIWDAIDGSWTAGNCIPRYDLSVGNPWHTSGRLWDAFHKHRDLYRRRHLRTPDVEGTDPKYPERIAKKHGGTKSKFYRVQVEGDFPEEGSNQFIEPETIEGALARPLIDDPGAPLVLGFDIARLGEDSSVIMPRRGLDITMKPYVAAKRDLAYLTNWAEKIILELKPRRVFVDAQGLGAGVCDHLIERFTNKHGQSSLIVGIYKNEDAEDEQYEDMRTELWGRMRFALKNFATIGTIEELERLVDDLHAPKEEVSHRSKTKLESVDDLKSPTRQGGAKPSPDWATALALTYYQPVPREDFGLWTPDQGGQTHAGGLHRKLFRS